MSHVEHLTRATLEGAPPPCRGCMWWQAPRRSSPAERERWTRDVEDGFGPWGKLYHGDGRAIGLLQYGPSERFRRAAGLPAGPPSRDAVLVTCAFITDASPWALQSLFLAAIGECRDRGAPALEAFAYRYASGETFSARFLTHRTIFSKDFLSDFGFVPLRAHGRIELMRLDLRALVPAAEPTALERLERLRARLVPAPAPVAPA